MPAHAPGVIKYTARGHALVKHAAPHGTTPAQLQQHACTQLHWPREPMTRIADVQLPLKEPPGVRC